MCYNRITYRLLKMPAFFWSLDAGGCCCPWFPEGPTKSPYSARMNANNGAQISSNSDEGDSTWIAESFDRIWKCDEVCIDVDCHLPGVLPVFCPSAATGC
uniref:Uncharacterized protein n=1 Tax=Setaria italica TaxID=4555 RepID=K3ZNV3_SETIT